MIDLSFDNGTVEQFTVVLSQRDYTHLGQLSNIRRMRCTNNLNSANEFSFEVCKELDDHEEVLWDEIYDLRLIWIKELDEYYEIRVELTDQVYMTKTITCTSLCECELSQAGLYDIEINTADDIARPDYDVNYPTVFYRTLPDPSDPNYSKIKTSSLLHRILDKVPAYSIGHVDSSLANLQRTFSISNTTVYDFLTGDCSDQFNCMFKFNSVDRTVSAYDLYTVCLDCGHRGDFNDVCPKCGSTNLKYFGEDTCIFVSTENLTDEVVFETDVDSIKNAFRLEAGDDNMTAAVINSNPNGSRYIYEFSEEARRDMPEELVQKMSDYDVDYNFYNEEYEIIGAPKTTMPTASATELDNVYEYIGTTDTSFTNGYFYRCIKNSDNTYSWICVFNNEFNSIVSKYSQKTCQICGNRWTGSSSVCSNCRSTNIVQKTWNNIETITGYKELIPYYYECIDLYSYLQSSMMPQILIPTTTVSEERDKIQNEFSTLGFSISLSKVTATTVVATVNNAVLNYAKTLVNTGYVKVTIDSDNKSYPNGYDQINQLWSGRIKVTNYEDENDFAYTTYYTSIAINDDLDKFLDQKIIKQISKNDAYAYDALKLIQHPQADYGFSDVIRLYSATRLESFHDAIEAVLGILIDAGQGVYSSDPNSIYQRFYLLYYNALRDCETELNTRNREIAAVWGSYNTQGIIMKDGVIQFIADQVTNIHNHLNFEEYVGSDLYKIFTTYIREETYSNSNYISDGLDNDQLFSNAQQFLERAKEELHKAATYQHSIKSNLDNLLAIEEFKPLLNKFELGNWIRVKADDTIYRLRLIGYSIDFDSLQKINTEFSDVTITANGLNDIQSIIKQASSISSSYGYVEKQAESGAEARYGYIDDWVKNGLNSALIRINNNNDEDISIDETGIIARTYDDTLDDFGPEQLRITHNVLAFTKDNWETVSTALGKFTMKYHAVDDNGINWSTTEVTDPDAYGLVANAVLAGKVVGSIVEGGTIIGSHFQIPGNAAYIDMSSDATTTGKNNYIYFGTNFYVNKSGNLTCTGADISGKLTAKYGSIGAWTVDPVSGSGATTIYSGGALYSGTPGSGLLLAPNGYKYNSSYAGASSGTTWKIMLGTGFGITSGGSVYVNGAIYATSGNFGTGNTKVTIGDGCIYYGKNSGIDTNADGFYVGSNGISCGKTSTWSPSGTSMTISKFKVTNAGTLYANDAYIQGTISASVIKGSTSFEMTAAAVPGHSTHTSTLNWAGTWGDSLTVLASWDGAGVGTQHGNNNREGVFVHWDDIEYYYGSSTPKYAQWTTNKGDSDKRLKKNVRELSSDILQKFYKELHPIIFNYKKKVGIDGTFFGVFAQDMEKALESIGIDDSHIVYEREDGYKRLCYAGTVGFQIGAVKDLYRIVNKQQEELNILQQEIQRLKGEYNG